MARLSLGIKSRREHPLNVATIPNCEFWVDLARTETITYASGANVQQVSDMSGKARHLTKTGSGNDTIYPVYQPAENGVLFINTVFDQMVAGNIGDWNFLHNGNGCTVMMLVKVDSAMAANGVMLSTAAEASGGYGTNIWYFNTSQQYQISTRAGASQTFFNTGAANTLIKNVPTIISMHMQSRAGAPFDLVTRSNGATDLKLNNLAAYATNDSTGTLYIGKLASGTSKCKFVFKKCAIFSRRISKAEENLILEDWAKSENIAITRYGEMDLAVLAGQNNAKGHGNISETNFATTPTVANASIFNNTSMAWASLQAGVSNDSFSSSTLGIEMNLAQQFTTLSGKPLYVVKLAADNTAISSWAAASANFVNLQADMQRAYWNLEDSGYVVKPVFIWYHGETDAADATLGANYATNLQSFLTSILSNQAYAQAQTYIVQINQSPSIVATDAVRSAQLATAMTTPYSAYAHLVEVDDLADHIDRDTMKADALNAIGSRIAHRYLKVTE
jgi:hypothetical protein